MSTGCLADSDHLPSLADRLNDQRKDGAFCDVLLKISGQVLPTHSSVLSACSPFFRGLICGDRPTPPHLTAGAAPQEIEMELLGVVGPLVLAHESGGLEAVAGLVDFIYTGKINLREDCVDLVVQLAEAFMLDSLSALIKTYVESAKTRQQTTRAKPGRPGRSVTSSLPVRRNRKMPPTKLRTAPPAAEAAQPDGAETRTRVLRARKRVVPAVVQVSEGEDGCDTEDQEEEEGDEEGSWTKKKKHRKETGTESGGDKQKPKRTRYRFRCKQCDFVSFDQHAIRDHKVEHPTRTFQCVACSFVTGRSLKLLQHVLAAKHRETKCSLCGHEAGDAVALREHLARHDHPKPHFCHFCEQRFTSPSLLALHAPKHTTERPFTCGTCNRGFKMKNNLQKHMLCHAPEKNHMCDQCDFRTAYKGTLRMHLRIHTGEMISCPHEGCNFQAYSKSRIAQHSLTHSKEKTHVCEVCGQKYAQIESLRRHSKLHNPDTKFLRCELCPYATTRRDKMREHSKKSHTGNPTEPGRGNGGRTRKPPRQLPEQDGTAGDADRKQTQTVGECHVTARRLQGFIDQQQQLQSRVDVNLAPKKLIHNYEVDNNLQQQQQHLHQMSLPSRVDGYPTSSEGRWDPPALLDPRAHHFPMHRDQSSLMNFMASHGTLL